MRIFTGRTWGGEEIEVVYDGLAWRGAFLGEAGVSIHPLCSGPRPRGARMDPRLYADDRAGWDLALRSADV